MTNDTYIERVGRYMSSFPERPFRMAQLVREFGPCTSGRDRLRVRVGIRRALRRLQAARLIKVGPTRLSRGGFAIYTWVGNPDRYHVPNDGDR